eukprot:2251745-Pyramimonas_sp.AAC.1
MPTATTHARICPRAARGRARSDSAGIICDAAKDGAGKQARGSAPQSSGSRGTICFTIGAESGREK